MGASTDVASLAVVVLKADGSQPVQLSAQVGGQAAVWLVGSTG